MGVAQDWLLGGVKNVRSVVTSNGAGGRYLCAGGRNLRHRWFLDETQGETGLVLCLFLAGTEPDDVL